MVVGGFKSSPAPPDNPSNLVTRQHCTLYFCLQACPPYGNSYRKYVVTVALLQIVGGDKLIIPFC